jgi:hypothetical protein
MPTGAVKHQRPSRPGHQESNRAAPQRFPRSARRGRLQLRSLTSGTRSAIRVHGSSRARGLIEHDAPRHRRRRRISLESITFGFREVKYRTGATPNTFVPMEEYAPRRVRAPICHAGADQGGSGTRGYFADAHDRRAAVRAVRVDSPVFEDALEAVFGCPLMRRRFRSDSQRPAGEVHEVPRQVGVPVYAVRRRCHKLILTQTHAFGCGKMTISACCERAPPLQTD